MPNRSTPLQAALSDAVAAVHNRWPSRPRVGLVLGSGLGDLAEYVELPCVIRFADIPHHPQAGVAGHAGELVCGSLEGVRVAVWRGRAHFYEGRSMLEVGFPVRLLHQLGGETIILTNAAGSLNESLQPGELMLISDHINLPGLVGHSPLRPQAPLAEPGGDQDQDDRFVDLSDAYDPELRRAALRIAEAHGFSLREGVYTMAAGPNYETPSEARMLRLMGADAVGMSTVPEVIVARQLGLRVLAISAITNAVFHPSGGSTTHAQVLATASHIKPRVSALVRGLLASMSVAGSG